MADRDLWKQDEWKDSEGRTHHSNGETSYTEGRTTFFSGGGTLTETDSGLLKDEKGDLWKYNSCGRLVRY